MKVQPLVILGLLAYFLGASQARAEAQFPCRCANLTGSYWVAQTESPEGVWLGGIGGAERVGACLEYFQKDQLYKHRCQGEIRVENRPRHKG